MTQYALRRLVETVPILLGVTLLTFLILHLAPGDPTVLIGGPTATAEEIANIRARLNLDRPLPEQYLTFVGGLLRGDLGQSVQRRLSVREMIAVRLPDTLFLAAASMVVTLFGVEEFTAIIPGKDVAVLALGAASQQPVVEQGSVTIGTVITMTLTVDHRWVNGVDAARFLGDLKRILEAPPLDFWE